MIPRNTNGIVMMLLVGSPRWPIKIIWDLWAFGQQCATMSSVAPGHAAPLERHSVSRSTPAPLVTRGKTPRADSRWRWRSSAPHTLTCLRDQRVQGLGLPEALAITGSPVFQPIGLAGLGARGRGRAVAQGGPIPLRCLLGPLSLETHSRGRVNRWGMERSGSKAAAQQIISTRDVGTTERRTPRSLAPRRARTHTAREL